ncbi:class I SAM-dependent methyltransferase [Acaryochloris sp. CCMEE 5410]|uniref:class I SAM-dependent methyltransferase n=1 Tax=Acaryochloris sp. CCMEE 5410 TaxID=310037 RepID=UPI00024848E0|nr:class I SAM-dependent methyltransferase [Acaryochloris sp. CCMEE 5410]KAI9133155.1 class I SAM-dependent methyltransferase [Acaryochloris sp. CCMEE 5410]
MITANKQVTQALYNDTAVRWVRGEPSSLSDFTARPAILEMCAPVTEQKILDLGCGEGYCSRQLRQLGAASVLGVDLSQRMIEAAQAQEEQESLGITYQVGCATDVRHYTQDKFDLVVAVFLFNYLTVAQTQACMAEIFQVLEPGGRFIFSIPHPAFPYMRQAEFPFYFEVDGNNYFSGRDQQCPGRIWKRDGSWLDVQLIHKTLQDFFEALQMAGFTSMPTVRELRVLPEHVELDPDFFGPLVDYPLHMAIEVHK